MGELNNGLCASEKALVDIQRMLDFLDERIAELERKVGQMDEICNEIRVLSVISMEVPV